MRIRKTNQFRATRAIDTMHYYLARLYPNCDIGSDELLTINEEGCIDLITDILHACQLNNIKILPVVNMAKSNYEAVSGKTL